MKKRLTALLVVISVVFSLTACGYGSKNRDNPDDSSKISLKVWVPKDELAITQEMCAAFDEAHPEYEISFEISAVGIDEAENMLTNDPEQAADVMQMPSGAISQLNDAGLLLPISANVDEVKSLYGDGAISAVTRYYEKFDMDLMYGVPFSPNCFFMYYNKDLYTEEEVKNLDTMMAKDLGDGVYNFSFTLHDSWYLESFFYAAGCTLFGEDGMDPTDCTWNNENGLAAARYIADLVANPKYIEDRDGVAGAMMKDGKLGALCSGDWSYDDLHKVLGDKLGACALPVVNINGTESRLSNFADYRCYVVKINTDEGLAAQLLAEWLANTENQLIHYESEAQTAPCALELMDNEEVKSNVAVAALIEQTQYAVPQPSISQVSNYWTPVAALGEGFEKGSITMSNAQSELDKAVEQILSSLTD